MSPPPSSPLGAAGEEAAAAALRRAGWTLLDRNVRVGRGEIDLIMERGGVLGFVEVKTRSGRGGGTPEEGVDGRKRRRFATAVEAFLARKGLAAAPRVLLVAAVDADGDGHPRAVRVVPMED